MAQNIFDKWNKSVDLTGLKADIESASQNNGTGNYVEVPVGTYEVKVVKGEVKATKNGDPMVSMWFEIVDGEYKGQKIFMNQVITQGFQIHIVDDFLKTLDTGVEVHFEDYAQYNDLIMDVVEACESQKLSYALEYGQTAKGFSTFNVNEVFEN